RETGSWAPTVHKLLRHLEVVGFQGAPRVVGSGFDDRGRETLTYIEGEFIHPGPWREDAFPLIGRFLRDFHTATQSFAIPSDAIWRPWHGRSIGGPDSVIGHCDTGPWNFLARGRLPHALIDWENAGPVDPRVELPRAARCGFLDIMIELAVHDAADQVMNPDVVPETTDPTPLWG
ncbi:MAG: aminoglycoside phosphotransferase family protein, partial [Candidatus Eisenbacteria bacterium]|nr:aminoglycoside phosphotransferase family protein [Candidatus Eisenbacteria bacterium]